jgi:hypothetical protein
MTSDPENPLLIDILSASNTAYSYKPDDKIVDVNFNMNSSLIFIDKYFSLNLFIVSTFSW